MGYDIKLTTLRGQLFHNYCNYAVVVSDRRTRKISCEIFNNIASTAHYRCLMRRILRHCFFTHHSSLGCSFRPQRRKSVDSRAYRNVGREAREEFILRGSIEYDDRVENAKKKDCEREYDKCGYIGRTFAESEQYFDIGS